MIIAVDFDGVIHDHKNPLPGKKMGMPIIGTKDGLEKLKSGGHEIIIYTARRDYKPIMDFMNYYKLPFNLITSMKPKADWYIDDKAIRFNSWSSLILQ